MNDRILRACLRAYPRPRREQDGEVLLTLSRDLISDGSSLPREAAGLVTGGLVDRLRLARREFAGAPWYDARTRLALPLSAALLALVVAGTLRASHGIAWIGWGWSSLLIAAACAVVGTASGRRSLSFIGGLLLMLLSGLDATRDLGGSQVRWVGSVGGANVDMLVMALPAALLLLTTVPAIPVVAKRMQVRRLAWGLLPAALAIPLARTGSQAVEPILIYCAFAITAAVAILSIARRNAIESAVAALLVAAASLPALWVGAAVLPIERMPLIARMPLIYFALGLILTASVVRALVRAPVNTVTTR